MYPESQHGPSLEDPYTSLYFVGIYGLLLARITGDLSPEIANPSLKLSGGTVHSASLRGLKTPVHPQTPRKIWWMRMCRMCTVCIFHVCISIYIYMYTYLDSPDMIHIGILFGWIINGKWMVHLEDETCVNPNMSRHPWKRPPTRTKPGNKSCCKTIG